MTGGPPKAGPPEDARLSRQLTRCHAELVKQAHHVEVVAVLLELVLLDLDDLARPDLEGLARWGDGSLRALQWARVRSLPGDLAPHAGAVGERAGARATGGAG